MTGSTQEPGLIPRLCSALFTRIRALQETAEVEASISRHPLRHVSEHISAQVSYMEIYNEKVFDLLDLSGEQKSGLKVGCNE